MSQLLDSLKIGDTIEIKGPIGEIVYASPGKLFIKKKERKVSHMAMMAGGTGITPMYQLLKAVLTNPDDDTVCSLIYANQTPNDILLRQEVSSRTEHDFVRPIGAPFACACRVSSASRELCHRMNTAGKSHSHQSRLWFCHLCRIMKRSS